MNAAPHHCVGDCQRAERKILQLREMVEQLEYERDHWKREAGQLVEADLIEAIQAEFGLTQTEATICAGLYQRRGKLFSSSSLEGLLDEERGCTLDSNVVSVMMGRVRAKLGDEAIETVRGRGYRLSDSMIEEFDRRIGTK